MRLARCVMLARSCALHGVMCVLACTSRARACSRWHALYTFNPVAYSFVYPRTCARIFMPASGEGRGSSGQRVCTGLLVGVTALPHYFN